ncbi:putative claudin-25 [Echinops telfairi]|uniref:Claudin-25 n=1 Tax=Echinops telfairi TaxID=9371 RepID=A0ABM0J9F7_ECHTE|nr:putative claudin-25 [Echinops telfairi]
MRTRLLCFIQYAGLLVAVAGHVCSLVTLFLPQWLTFSSEFLEKETFMLGLWEACVTQDPGESVCKAYTNLLEISTDIRMARVLMCLAGAIGTFGFLTIIPGLTCLRYWGHLGSPFDRSMNIAGGAFFFLAGLTTLVPVSYMAHVTVQKFWSPKFTTYTPRWKYGSAMFCEDVHKAGFILTYDYDEHVWFQESYS